MVDKLCEYLTKKIRNEMPEIDDEKAEVINYGLQIIVGEIPKTFIMLVIAWALGILEWTIVSFLLLLPYRMYAGGFHLKSHIGCIIGTSIMYTGNAFISQQFTLDWQTKIIFSVAVWIFAVAMIKKYAPADTEEVPVISRKERKKRKIISYCIVTVMMVASIIIKNSVISNILIVGGLLQTFAITRLAYFLTNNKYGYEEYIKNKNIAVN